MEEIIEKYTKNAWDFHSKKDYKKAEDNYLKLIEILEKECNNNKDFNLQYKYAMAFCNYACMLMDRDNKVSEKAEELTNKSLDILKKLENEFSEENRFNYGALANCYANIALQYKKDYKRNNNEEFKNKYYELFRNEIFYREKLKELGIYEDDKAKVENYYFLGKAYYYLYEDDNARINYNQALEIAQNAGLNELANEIKESMTFLNSGEKVMEEKTIKMILFYVLAIYDDDKQTVQTCIEVIKLLIAMVKNEETKADELLNSFPQEHPVSKLYNELKNQNNLLELLEYSKEKFKNTKIDTNAIRSIQDDEDVEKLSIELSK